MVVESDDSRQAMIRTALLECVPGDLVVAWISCPHVTTEGAPLPVFNVRILRQATWEQVRWLPSHARLYARDGRECVSVVGMVGHG